VSRPVGRHRIFVVDLRHDRSPDEAQRHWTDEHGLLFLGTPGLGGYAQNRPSRVTGRVCSQTWFESREAERRAYDSPYYRDVVAADEADFLERSSAWTAVVTSSLREGRPGPCRAMIFGREVRRAHGSASGRQILALDRPWTGGGPVVTVLHAATPAALEECVDRELADLVVHQEVLRRPAGIDWP
jgi:hypothetical protein